MMIQIINWFLAFNTYKEQQNNRYLKNLNIQGIYSIGSFDSMKSIEILYLDILFQIRAEKPYYMADPEVDSLVSYTNTSRQLNISPVLPREIFLMFFHATLSRAGLLTGIGKNSNENAYLHHDKLKRGKGRRSFQWHFTVQKWKNILNISRG